MKESIDVLRALDSSAWVSGNDIAARLGVSPATARRRIKKLRVLGFDILSSPGQGYRLSEALEFLDPGRLRGALAAAGLVTATRLEVMDTVESTSTRLLRWSGSDDLHGRACVTEYQSQGRGRRGRAWFGVPCRNIMLSVAWQLGRGPDRIHGLSLSLGLAVARRLEALGAQGVQLKWPNDVLCHRGKLAGILVDVLAGPGQGCRVVVGLGINLLNPGLIEHLAGRQVADLSELTENLPHRTDLAAMLLIDLAAALEAFDLRGFGGQAGDWNRWDAYRGRVVCGRTEGSTIKGQALGVDELGAYRIRCKDRTVESLLAGEIIPVEAGFVDSVPR